MTRLLGPRGSLGPLQVREDRYTARGPSRGRSGGALYRGTAAPRGQVNRIPESHRDRREISSGRAAERRAAARALTAVPRVVVWCRRRDRGGSAQGHLQQSESSEMLRE